MRYLVLFIKSILFGASNLIPGASGGTTLVITGIYDETIDNLSNIFKKFKKSIIFLAILILGAIVGILGGGKLINIALDKIPFITYMLFLGIVVGTLPMIAKPVIKKINVKYSISFIVSLGVIIGLMILGSFLSNGTKTYNNLEFNDYLLLFLCGFVGFFAMIIPGVSGILMFLVFGYYDALMKAISNIYDTGQWGAIILFMLPIGLGIIVSIIPSAKIINYLLKKFPIGSIFAIIGFVIGSIVCMLFAYFTNKDYPALDTLNIILGIICFIIGTLGSFFISFYAKKLEKKKDDEIENIDNKEEKIEEEN